MAVPIHFPLSFITIVGRFVSNMMAFCWQRSNTHAKFSRRFEQTKGFLSFCVFSSERIVVPAGDELLVEATQGLREWRWKLRELYVVKITERLLADV